MKCLICALFLFGCVSTQGEVDTDWIKSTLENHFSKPRHHVANPSYKSQTRDFILQEFKNYGLETHVDTFSTLLLQVKGHNIIGILKGENFKTAQDRIIGIAAHYDTMRDTPGVDDNGAAVTVMLLAAKELAKQKRKNTVVFVAFDFEEWEQGVSDIACSSLSCGSQHFLQTWVKNFWTTTPKVKGVMVMDTIMNVDQTDGSQGIPTGFDLLFPNVVASINSDGKEGDFITAIGRPYDSDVLNAFVSSYNSLGQPEFELEKVNIAPLTGPTVSRQQFFQFQDLMRSDHYSFWKRGVPAIFITDTANFRGYMKTCYHEECDMMSRVTDKMIQFAGKTGQALIGAVDKLESSGGSGNSGSSSCFLTALLLVGCLYCWMF